MGLNLTLQMVGNQAFKNPDFLRQVELRNLTCG
jgi:hypothetical protein